MKQALAALFLLFSSLAHANVVDFIAFGDAPYFMPEGESMFNKLIIQVNTARPDFAVHVGDIRGSDTTDCSDAVILNVARLFTTFQVPLVYTPGDNEWTDCHLMTSGPNDPLERLSFIRKTFFANDKSLGRPSLHLAQQSTQAGFADYVENSRWQMGEIVFATLHIVGSNNNNDPTRPSAVAEFTTRTAANIEWMKQAFAQATRTNAKVLVLFFQANLRLEAKPEERTGFNSIIEEMTKLVQAYKGQVLAVQGDFHNFIVDHPLVVKNAWDVEWPVDNFTRLQVYGAPDVRGIKVKVDTSKEQPFIFESLPNIPWEYPR